MSKSKPDVVDKLNQALIAGRPLSLDVMEMLELATFVNEQGRIATECTAMLNLYVEKQQGQVSYQAH